MEINWVILGWLIDMLLNGFVWLVIAAIFLTLIDLTDTWTRKAFLVHVSVKSINVKKIAAITSHTKPLSSMSISQPKITQFISI